jgi:fructosamine-3-kinase
MLPDSINQFLNSFHSKRINQFSAVGGGSINDAYRYEIEGQEFFIKYNNKVEGIIEKEVDGLKSIAKLNCIATPEVIAFDKKDGYEILVLPFISGALKTEKAWKNFGK